MISDTIRTVPLPEEAFTHSSHTSVWWLGAAGFLMNIRGTVLLLDPVLKKHPEKPGYCETGAKMRTGYAAEAEEIKRADLVLYTHSDCDHMGELTVQVLQKTGAKMCGPYPVFYQLMRLGVPFDQCRVLRYGETMDEGDIHIEVLPADHPWQLEGPEEFGVPFRIGECVGYIINTPDGRFLFPGDTRLMEMHLTIQNIDVMALDVSDSRYHLGPDGAVVLANHLSDALLIPMHYATYDEPTITGHTNHMDEEIIPRVKDWDKRARVLNIGEGIHMLEGKLLSSTH